jgi:hypothetical protein
MTTMSIVAFAIIKVTLPLKFMVSFSGGGRPTGGSSAAELYPELYLELYLELCLELCLKKAFPLRQQENASLSHIFTPADPFPYW